MEQVELVFPPDEAPPISLGVRGPKSLAISGSAADGTILAEFSSTAYVSWAKNIIEQNKPDDRKHRLTVFVYACAGGTNEKACEQVRPLIASAIASGNVDSQLAPMGILPEVNKLREQGDFERLKAAIPHEWIDHLAIVGTRENWERSIKNFVEAGADTVVLVPTPDKETAELEVFANHILD